MQRLSSQLVGTATEHEDGELPGAEPVGETQEFSALADEDELEDAELEDAEQR